MALPTIHDLRTITTGSVLYGGGVSMLLHATGKTTALCLNLIGEDAGRITEWGPCVEVLDAAGLLKTLEEYGVEIEHGFDARTMFNDLEEVS